MGCAPGADRYRTFGSAAPRVNAVGPDRCIETFRRGGATALRVN